MLSSAAECLQWVSICPVFPTPWGHLGDLLLPLPSHRAGGALLM